jgi:hypothetical protein
VREDPLLHSDLFLHTTNEVDRFRRKRKNKSFITSEDETLPGLIVNGGRHQKRSERLKKFEWETVRER